MKNKDKKHESFKSQVSIKFTRGQVAITFYAEQLLTSEQVLEYSCPSLIQTCQLVSFRVAAWQIFLDFWTDLCQLFPPVSSLYAKLTLMAAAS